MLCVLKALVRRARMPNSRSLGVEGRESEDDKLAPFPLSTVEGHKRQLLVRLLVAGIIGQSPTRHASNMFGYHWAYLKLGNFSYVGAIGWLMNEPGVVSIEFGWPGLSYLHSFSKSRTGIWYSVLSSETCNSLSPLTNSSSIGDKRFCPPERLSADFMIPLNVAEVEELLACSWPFLSDL